MTTSSLRWFLRDESGATAIEYGLIAALVCIAAMGAMNAFAGSTIAMYDVVLNAIANALP